MTTYSTSLKLELPGDGQQTGTWGQTTNKNLGDLLEQAITGVQTVAMSDANYTLTNLNGTLDEARNAVLKITGTLTAQRDIIAPVQEKLYTIYNNTTGGFAIRVIGASGTGVVIPNGMITQVYFDGTNYLPLQNGVPGNFVAYGNLGVSGTTVLDGATTVSNALTYGGVTLSNSVTGTGSMVLSASPTFTGTPAVPTATAGTNTTQAASTAFVTSALSGLGTMSTQNANNVSITGGTISGLGTPLPVASGGTGAATLSANAVVLGNGTSAVQTVAPSTAGNLLVSNGTTWTSATLASSGVRLGLGITGETWHNVAGSRSANQTYTNNYSYPIMVNIQLHTGSAGTNPSYIYVNGTVTARASGGGWTGGMDSTGTVIVPPGATYSTNSSAAGDLWMELY